MARFREILNGRRGLFPSVSALLAQKGATRSTTDGLLAVAALAVSTTATKFKTTAIAIYQIAGLIYNKAATDALMFTAAHTVTKQKHGIVLVQINAAGVISTKVPASPQTYTTAQLALAAKPALDAGKIELATLAIAADRLTDGLRAIATLAISGSDAHKFKTTTTDAIVIGGASTSKVATDNLTFTAAHVVTTLKFGVVLVQQNAAGAISTKVPLATQAYNDAPTALAALPAADAANVAIGYITIHAGGADFTANATPLTGISGFVDGTPTSEHDFVANTDSLALVTTSFTNPALVTA